MFESLSLDNKIDLYFVTIASGESTELKKSFYAFIATV